MSNPIDSWQFMFLVVSQHVNNVNSKLSDFFNGRNHVS